MIRTLLKTYWLPSRLVWAIAVSLCLSVPADEVKPLADAKAVEFARDVQPILRRACLHCHGPGKQKGEYRLDLRQIALKGGESYAPNIIPGKSAIVR